MVGVVVGALNARLSEVMEKAVDVELCALYTMVSVELLPLIVSVTVCIPETVETAKLALLGKLTAREYVPLTMAMAVTELPLMVKP